MASIDSDIYVVQNTEPAPAGYGSQLGANFAYYDTTIAVGSSFGEANDTANLFIVPAGYRAVPSLWNITCEDLGTTATLHIGTTADPDSIAKSVDVHAAKWVGAAYGGVEWLTPTTTTKATTFIATLASAASLTAGKKIVIRAVFAKM